MSDETQKDIVDVVKSSVDAAIELKADKAEVEAVKSALENLEMPSVEGFVKSEEVAEMKAELEATKSAHEELKAIINAAPAINKGEPEMSGNFQWDGEGFNAKASVDLSEFYKEFTSTTNVTGARTDSQRLYYAMQQRNPFRGVATIMPTGATAVNLPQLTGIAAAAEAAIPNSINLATGHAGGISSVQVVPQNWTSRTFFSDQSVEDLPGLDAMVASFMGQAIARAEAGDMVTQMDANSAVGEVNTGVATALPARIDEWADLMAALDSAYLDNAMWSMSRQAYATLRSTAQSSGAELLFDAGLGKMTFLGYPILINDHLDAGNAAGQNPVYFGDHMQGLIIANRREMNISRHEDTVPGGMYYYGNMRSRGLVWDANALVRFNVSA